MDRLSELDEVAYVRFASVYRRFTDIAGFEHELSQIKQRSLSPKCKRSAPPGNSTRDARFCKSTSCVRAQYCRITVLEYEGSGELTAPLRA
jgi:hypothetical protein